jgi:hypothetical protein
MQLATFLLDYACFMNSSDLLQSTWIQKPGYRNSRSLIFGSIQDLSDQEIAWYNDHEIAAASSLRSVLDAIDRGNIVLHKLSSERQGKINKRGRKDEIPENCKDRNWLIQALTKLETIKDPFLIQFKRGDFFVKWCCSSCSEQRCGDGGARHKSNRTKKCSGAAPQTNPGGNPRSSLGKARFDHLDLELGAWFVQTSATGCDIVASGVHQAFTTPAEPPEGSIHPWMPAVSLDQNASHESVW